jgi:hypothetical protein
MKRKINILLTQFPGMDAKALRRCTGFPYCHASVGLEEDMNTFYSFVVKGFIVEDIHRYCKRDASPCALYQLEVTPEVYERVRNLLQSFVRQKPKLRYSYLGLLLSLIHIPSRWKHRYFCSQFVAQVLQRCHATRLRKSSTTYLPRDLHRLQDLRLVFQGDLPHMLERYATPA